MIDGNKRDGFVLICDICGEEAPDSFDFFNQAVEYKKENGWKSQYRNNSWEDICPECQ